MELERDSDCDYSSLSFRSYLENGELKNEQVLLSENNQELFFFFSDLASKNRGGKLGDSVVVPRNERGKIIDNFRSRSFRETGSGSDPGRVGVVCDRSPSQKVNISSLASMSAKSRRRMFMFGPVKFEQEMDLVAIKERQRRRLSPNRVSPVAGETAESGELEKALLGWGDEYYKGEEDKPKRSKKGLSLPANNIVAASVPAALQGPAVDIAAQMKLMWPIYIFWVLPLEEPPKNGFPFLGSSP